MWRAGLQTIRRSRSRLATAHRSLLRPSAGAVREYSQSAALLASKPKRKFVTGDGEEFEEEAYNPDFVTKNHDSNTAATHKGSFRHLKYEEIVRAVQDADRDFLRSTLPTGIEVGEADDALNEDVIERQVRDLYMEEYKKDMNKKFLRAFPLGITIGPYSSRRQTKNGKVVTFRAIVVGGNGRGFGAFGFGRGPSDEAAVNNAIRDLWNNTLYVPRSDRRTFPHPVRGKYSKTEIILRPSRRGALVTANPMVTEILGVFGVTDATAKIIGNRNPLSVVRAIFNGMSQMRSVEESAKARGKVVYRFSDDLDKREQMPSQKELDEKTEQVCDLMKKAMNKSVFMRYNLRVKDEQRAVEDFKKKSEKEIFYLISGKQKPDSSIEDPIAALEPKISQLSDVMRSVLTKVRMGVVENINDLLMEVRGSIHIWAVSNLYKIPEEELMDPVRIIAAKYANVQLSSKDDLEAVVKDMFRAVTERVDPMATSFRPHNNVDYFTADLDSEYHDVLKAMNFVSHPTLDDSPGDYTIQPLSPVPQYPVDLTMEETGGNVVHPELEDDEFEEVFPATEHDELVSSQPDKADIFKLMMKEGVLSTLQTEQLSMTALQAAGLSDFNKFAEEMLSKNISTEEVRVVAETMRKIGLEVSGEMESFLNQLQNNGQVSMTYLRELGEQLETEKEAAIEENFAERLDLEALHQNYFADNRVTKPVFAETEVKDTTSDSEESSESDDAISSESDAETEDAENAENVQIADNAEHYCEDELHVPPVAPEAVDPVRLPKNITIKQLVSEEEELQRILDSVDSAAVEKAKKAAGAAGVDLSQAASIGEQMAKMLRDLGGDFIPKEDLKMFEEELSRFEKDPESYVSNVMQNLDSNMALLQQEAAKNKVEAPETEEVVEEAETEDAAETEEKK